MVKQRGLEGEEKSEGSKEGSRECLSIRKKAADESFDQSLTLVRA